ncbi:MAG: DUF4157 domain-containing protein, partial [Microscillaceae bacterium]|nr:DUF4157 domain-containing protein [Microscillaceae bacterium]
AFGSGEYRPGTLVGDALLAHELAHVEQQKGASLQAQTKLEMGGAEYNALEQEADEVAVGVMGHIWHGGSSSQKQTIRPQRKTGLSLRRCSRMDHEALLQFGHTRLDTASGQQVGTWRRSTELGLITHPIRADEMILRAGSQEGTYEENFSSPQNAAAYAHTIIASRDAQGACIIRHEGQYRIYLIEMNPSPPFTRGVLEHEGGLSSSQVSTTDSEVVGVVNFVTSDGYLVPINHTIRDHSNRLDPDAIRTSDIEITGYQQVLEDIRSGRNVGLSSAGYIALFKGMLRANALQQLRENKQKLDQEQAKYRNDQSDNAEWIRLRQIIRQDQEIKQREDRLASRYAIQNAALGRLEEVLPEWEASSNPMVMSQLETFRTMRESLVVEVAGLRTNLDEARQGRARLRLEYPPLSVIDVTEVSDSTPNSLIYTRIVSGFNEVRQIIDDVMIRIHEEDIPLSKLGTIVTQTKEQMGITSERRAQGDDLSVAVLNWLDSEDTTESIITWTGTILSLVLGVAAIIASVGWAIFLGLAGSAIGLGTAVYEFERAEDLYAASRAGEATGGHLVEDPAAARFNYIMGWVNLLLAGLDLGLAARATSTLIRSGRIAEELATSLGGRVLRRLRPEQITRFDEAMRLRRAGDLEGAQRILDRLRTQLGDEVFTQAESLFGRSSKVRQLFGGLSGLSEEARRALMSLDEAILDRLPALGSTSVENIGQFIRRNGTEAAVMLNRMGDSALGIIARGGREADLIFDLHNRVLRRVPAGATSTLDASALIQLSDPAVVRQLESAISLQESRRLAGLEDWISFNGPKAAAEFEDALLELREAQRLAVTHPDEVVHLGMEVHAPTYPGTANRAPQFDLAARDASGAIVRSVEMTRIRSLIQSADDSALTEAVRHAADKAAVRHRIGIPVEGTLEASIEMGIDVGVSEGRTRVTRLADGTVTIARLDTGAVFRTTNIFDDFARRISSILNSQFLDRINLLDNGGNILASYERQGTTWSRIR